MNNAGENLAALQRLKGDPVWALLTSVLTDEMDKSLIPTVVGTDLNAIAIATVSRAATYKALAWVRDEMIGQVIAREKKALDE